MARMWPLLLLAALLSWWWFDTSLATVIRACASGFVVGGLVALWLYTRPGARL